MTERLTLTPVAPDFVHTLSQAMKKMAEKPCRRGRARRSRKGFRKHEISPDTPRGLFTVFLSDARGDQVGQVWAASPESAASIMAPWAKNRLRRGRKASEVPVELLGWDEPIDPANLSGKSGIPKDELDPGLTFGTELCHVWIAEHDAGDETSSLYVIETIPYDFGVVDEP